MDLFNHQGVLDLQLFQIFLQVLHLHVSQSSLEVEDDLPPAVSRQNSVGVGVCLARAGLVGEVQITVTKCDNMFDGQIPEFYFHAE